MHFRLERLLAGEEVQEIVFPDTLKEIGRYIFYGCKKLERLEFSDTLMQVGTGAFTGCGGLKELVIHQKKGTKFVWSGDGTSASNSYDMDENFFKTLESSGCLDLDLINKNSNFEIDSKASFSTFVPKIEKVLGEQSLLKNGTWAFLGNGYSDKASERYLFWTSFDTNKVGAKKKIPILIQTGDGKYYVSNSTTAERKNKSGTVTYVAISDHLFNKSMYNKVIMAGGGQVYSSLSEAYAAYEKELEKKEYKDYPSDYLQGYCLLRLP